MKSLSLSYRIYLACLAIFGFVFIMLVTYRYGAGVSSDGVRNLSTADNVAKENGFFDMTGGAFTWWPPLYPLVLAGLSFFTRGDVFLAAWVLNVILFSLNIYLWGILFFRAFNEKLIYAVLCGLIVLGSRSSLRLYANVFSEPLFITFTLVFMFFVASYLEKGKHSDLWWMFILAALASLQRYVGVALIGLAGLIGLLKESPRKWWSILLVGFLSAFPLAGWVYFHNYLQYGLLFGPRAPQTMIPMENVSLMLTKSLNWFMPLHPLIKPLMLMPWSILLPILIMLLLINKRADWLAWFKAFSQNRYVWPIVAFALLHTLILTFTVNTVDHRDLTSDRYYVTTMPALLIFIFLTFDKLVLSHFQPDGWMFRWGFPLLFAVWSIYPVFSMQEYIRDGMLIGEPSNYNIYNKAFANEMALIAEARKLTLEKPWLDIYSNYTSAVWFPLRHTVLQPPYQNVNLEDKDQLLELKTSYAGWPYKREVYLIWFTPNEFLAYASPEHLKTIANLKLLYVDENGAIYDVKPFSSP